MQALARDKLFPGLFLFGRGTKRGDEPFAAVFLTYSFAQLALLADLDQLASLISIFYMVSGLLSLVPTPFLYAAHHYPLLFCIRYSAGIEESWHTYGKPNHHNQQTRRYLSI